MTPNSEQTQAISYEVVARNFSEEAQSLIPDSIIEQTLEKEKICFENAALLQLPPTKLTGNNTLRYCKDLLRKKQPLPFLYSVLCYLTEVSILMLLFSIAMGIYGKLAAEKGGFFASFSFLYELILFAGITGWHTLSKRQMHELLSIPFSAAKPSEAEKEERKKALKHSRLKILFAILLLMTLTAGLVFLLDINKICTARMYHFFFAYVACMILFGIHNVIYSSHLISFFTVGILLVARRPSEKIDAATQQYLSLSYKQLLSLAHKTQRDCDCSQTLTKQLKASIHSRMTTERIYYILAIVILIILDIVCLGTMRSMATPALLLFFAVSILMTLVFIIALTAANHILKSTKRMMN